MSTPSPVTEIYLSQISDLSKYSNVVTSDTLVLSFDLNLDESVKKLDAFSETLVEEFVASLKFTSQSFRRLEIDNAWISGSFFPALQLAFLSSDDVFPKSLYLRNCCFDHAAAALEKLVPSFCIDESACSLRLLDCEDCNLVARHASLLLMNLAEAHSVPTATAADVAVRFSRVDCSDPEAAQLLFLMMKESNLKFRYLMFENCYFLPDVFPWLWKVWERDGRRPRDREDREDRDGDGDDTDGDATDDEREEERSSGCQFFDISFSKNPIGMPEIWSSFYESASKGNRVFHRLRGLDLSCTGLTQRSLHYLLSGLCLSGASASLTTLDLSYNPLDDASVKTLCDELSSRGSFSTSLRNLALVACYISPKSVARLLGLVASFECLVHVDLRHNSISAEDFRRVMSLVTSYISTMEPRTVAFSSLLTRERKSLPLVDFSQCFVPDSLQYVPESLQASLDFTFESAPHRFYERFCDDNYVFRDPESGKIVLDTSQLLKPQVDSSYGDDDDLIVDSPVGDDIRRQGAGVPVVDLDLAQAVASSEADALKSMSCRPKFVTNPAPSCFPVNCRQFNNSCYIDSVFFCMFYASGLFDSLLNDGVVINEVFRARSLLRRFVIDFRSGADVHAAREAFRDAVLGFPKALDLNWPPDGKRDEMQDATEFLQWFLRAFGYRPFRVRYRNENAVEPEFVLSVFQGWSQSDDVRDRGTSLQEFTSSTVEYLSKECAVPKILPIEAVRPEVRYAIEMNTSINLRLHDHNQEVVYRFHSCIVHSACHYVSIWRTDASPTGYMIFDDTAGENMQLRVIEPDSSFWTFVQQYAVLYFYTLSDSETSLHDMHVARSQKGSRKRHRRFHQHHRSHFVPRHSFTHQRGHPHFLPSQRIPTFEERTAATSSSDDMTISDNNLELPVRIREQVFHVIVPISGNEDVADVSTSVQRYIQDVLGQPHYEILRDIASAEELQDWTSDEEDDSEAAVQRDRAPAETVRADKSDGLDDPHRRPLIPREKVWRDPHSGTFHVFIE
eukprot:ANDGO_08494.mRNA.1 hypothetical protein